MAMVMVIVAMVVGAWVMVLYRCMFVCMCARAYVDLHSAGSLTSRITAELK